MTQDRDPSPRTSRKPSAAEETVTLLMHTVRNALMERHGLNEKDATDWADGIVCALRRDHGGDDVYLKALDTDARDAAIRAELRTGNAAEVAARYGITARRVYQIANQR